jgi:co-chaperonin GroES (HSP10)
LRLEADVHIRPLHDWLVVKLDALPEETPGGLVLPQGTSGMERQRTGTILRVGPGRRDAYDNHIPMGIVPGERIHFFREHLEHQQGKTLVGLLQELEKDVGMLRKDDILFVEET